jgi:outer membrane protein assembly factor BamB
VLALSRGCLALLDAATGRPVWEAKAPDDATAFTVADVAVHMLGSGRVHSVSLADGALRASVEVPWARHLAAEDDGPLIATGDGGAACNLEGTRWTIAASGQAAATPAVLHRGIALLRGAETSLYNASDGLPLATLPHCRDAALWPDLSCALLLEGEVAMHRLATHLSLV